MFARVGQGIILPGQQCAKGLGPLAALTGLMAGRKP